MKVWHKILIPPVVAILFLLVLGGVSVALMARQGTAIATLIKNRGGSITLALTAFQETGRVQASAYRTHLMAETLGAGSLKEQADSLLQMVARFRLGEQDGRQQPGQPRQQLAQPRFAGALPQPAAAGPRGEWTVF